MIALPDLIALNKRAARKPATQSRDCSFLFAKDGKSAICHSARTRSCFRLSEDATTTVFPRNGNPYQTPNKANREAFWAASYWFAQGQAAVDAFIEATEAGASVETANRLAFHASRPGWEAKRNKGTGSNKGQGEITARRKSGAAVESVGAFSWVWLHARTA